jgi:hypothetical protein
MNVKYKQQIIDLVKDGAISNCCFECANRYSDNEPYDSYLTCRKGKCAICGEKKTIAPAYKLFGYYKMV